MSLNSFNFLVYFAGLLAILYVLQLLKQKRIQIIVLLIFSYFFIAKSDIRFCFCVIAVTIIAYTVGLLLSRYKHRSILVGGGTALVAILGYFKYCNFFLESFGGHGLNIILPLGISFYVFSALSYIIDVYQGKYEAERNAIDFSLYISFFPKLTAGPIVRADDFIPQIKGYRGLDKEAFLTGIQIFVFGLFKKIVLADHIGVFVDDVFFAPRAFNTGTVIWGAISYSLQIYFDFSGYSDMAIGVAKIVGFDFHSNFNLPYLAENISEFWKRWHISLSSWLRDYVYIPLGGSRKGELHTYINLLLTMIISGIWHGAGWTFILWGTLHGALSCLHRFLTKKGLVLPRTVCIVINFILVTLLWIFFRATSVSNALDVLKGIFTAHTGIAQPYTWSCFGLAILIVSSVVGVKRRAGDGFYPLLNLRKFWSLVAFFTFCGLTIIMGYFGNTAFIYGAF